MLEGGGRAASEKRTEPPNLPATNDDQANFKLLGEAGALLFRLSTLHQPGVFPAHFESNLLHWRIC